MNFVHSVGFVWFDFPFGLKRELWDQDPLSATELGMILKKILSMHSFPWLRMVSCIRADMLDQYMKAFEDCQFGTQHPWYWYKTGFNQEFAKTLNTVEVLLEACYTSVKSKKEPTWLGSDGKHFKNPLNRHNFLSFPSVSSRFLDENGESVNQHEKPPQLLFEFLRRFSQPATNVLIIGAGSGGNVVGALKSECSSIIALEPDAEQYKNLVRRMRLLQAADKKNRDFVWLCPEYEIIADDPQQVDLTSDETNCLVCGKEFADGAGKDACAQCSNLVHSSSSSTGPSCNKVYESINFCSDECIEEFMKANAEPFPSTDAGKADETAYKYPHVPL